METKPSPKGIKMQILIKQATCPLSHQIMEDPVIACDGYTYDRKYIMKRFNRKRRSSMISHMTNEKMNNKNLISDVKIEKILIVLARIYNIDINININKRKEPEFLENILC